MTQTPMTASVREAAFTVLKQFGFFHTAIELWRSPSASSSPTPVGVVAGGIIPASAAAALALPPIDDFSGARGDYISYTYSGSITIQDGDELHLVDTSSTLIYPVEGISEWHALQIGNLTTVRAVQVSGGGTSGGGHFLMSEDHDYLMGDDNG